MAGREMGERLTFLSLFAGIGGFELGFERAGMACEQQVEIDDNCNVVLAYHWPDVQRLEDVKDVGRYNLKAVDLVCGGFPCQDVSVAGRREGLDGERSGLWFEFIRIVEELEPKWVVVENVPGLLSSNEKRDFAAILSGLGQRGYWWAYRVLDAQFYGVPQRRRRVFVVGCLARGCAQEVLFERESSPWDTPSCRETGEGIAAPLTKGSAASGGVNPPGRRKEDDVNLVFPGMAQSGAGWAPPSLPIDENRSGPLDTKRAQCVLTTSGKGYWTEGVRALSARDWRDGGPGVVATLNNGGNDGGFRTEPGEHLIPFDTTQITSGLNRSNPQSGDPCHPLAAGGHAPAIISRDAVPKTAGGKVTDLRAGNPHISAVLSNMDVRRLTPTECERLQGFPDGWTAVDGMSDSARYRMLGNAVCVPVAEWLGRRVVIVERGEI